NILLAILGHTTVIAIVGVIGYFAFDREEDIIQVEVEEGEYRVTCKFPGRIREIKVREGDYVRKGDVLAVLELHEACSQE
ncbi:UNVERIFIED_CONTAM: biotin/lipoyl-binding protein, partial [Prevotella sp. 15_C9]